MQEEHHGSLIVNVITGSGKRGSIIELVKSKQKTSSFYSAPTVSVRIKAGN